MNRTLVIGIILLLLTRSLSVGQTIYLSPSHEVYSFLKRMEARQLLTDYKDAAKPLSRVALAKLLKALEPRVNEMKRVERETYEFLVTEFKYELLTLSGDSEPTEVRWHLFSTGITKGILNFDINYRLGWSFNKSDRTDYRTQGIKLYGYAFDNIGFYFNWIDSRESGKNVNYKRLHTPDPGIASNKINISTDKTIIEHNENDAQFTWQTGKFAFSLEKNINVWGYGKNGNVILSNKAPSYPQIKMRVPISNNIDFIYFHGELKANITDSSRLYNVLYPSVSYTRDVDRLKFIAAHQIEISLFKGVDLSLGESVIYSDRGPLLIYLIPVMLFKSGEWYNGDKDNVQMFGSIDLNVVKNVNAYLSLFVDELNTDDLFDPNLSRRQIAFTVGTQLFDIPATNLDLTLEYTRANPWVYNHRFPSVTFTNNGYNPNGNYDDPDNKYDLGHWIGQNADDIYLEMDFTPMHSLRIGIFAEAFRKGGKADIQYQYAQDGGNLPFLYDLQHEERSAGILGRYQPLRDVFFDFRVKMKKVESKIDPSLNQNNQVEFYLSTGVGL